MYSHLLHTIQLCQIPNPVLVKTPPLNLLFSFSAVVLLFQYVPKTQITKTFPFSYITAWFTNLADKRVKTCVSPTKYMGLSERILRQILTGKIMLHGLEHACQRQICRLFNLKSNICKNYIKEMEMWEWLEKLKNPPSLNDFFLPDYLLYLPSWKDTNNAPPYEVTECGFYPGMASYLFWLYSKWILRVSQK